MSGGERFHREGEASSFWVLEARTGGDVRWMESEVDQGSTFSFTARFKHRQQDTATGALLPTAVRGLPVLVVDENATSRRILDAMLVDYGMEPTQAGSARASVAAIEQAEQRGETFRFGRRHRPFGRVGHLVC